jgi:hypothetical protein
MIETSKIWVSKQSPVSGEINKISINANMESYERYLKGEILVQEIEPLLTPDEREFLLSGITSEEWVGLFDADEVE